MKKDLNKQDVLGSLREIYYQIQKGSDNKSDKDDFYWRPKECNDYKVPEFMIPESTAKGAKAKLHTQLSKTLAFIDLNKQRRFKDCCTIMPIPTTSRKLQSIYGNHRNVSRAIEFMERIGLISVEDSDFKFNQKNKENNRSKTYRYYYENELKIKEYCKLNSINKYVVVSNVSNNITLVDSCKIDSFEPSAVRFSTNLHLLKPDDFSESMFENYLKGVLYKNYPNFIKYDLMKDDVNKYYEDYPDFRIQFEPTFTWNKGRTAVTAIAIRATNSCCGATKEVKANRISRQEILDKYNLNLHKDVKSSVPRLTVSLNQGYWVSEDVDIYEDIFNRLIIFSNWCYDFENFRDVIKQLHMSAYFDNYSTIGKNINWKSKAAFEYEEVKEVMTALKEAVEYVEGNLYDVEIFYHESCIYLEVLKWLLDNGYFTWIVYDSWYSNGEDTQEEFEDLVTNLVEDTANNYIDEFYNSNMYCSK